MSENKLPKQGKFHKGHGVDCKYCGWTLKAHLSIVELEEFTRPRDDTEVSLHECEGYFPEDTEFWLKADEEWSKGHEIRRECAEKHGEFRAAWGGYAAWRRNENSKDFTEEEKDAARRNPNHLHVG